MLKFIEISSYSGDRRLININHISDISENYVYLDTSTSSEQFYFRCTESYEELKQKLIQAGVEVY